MSLPLLNAKKQYVDSNGSPLAGGQVNFYQPGTTTRVNTYQDQALTILNSNPLTLDANGQCVAWIGDSTSVREVVYDYLGNLIWDQVTAVGYGSNLSGSSGSSSIGFLQSGSGATLRTVQSKLRDVFSVADFGAVGDGVTDDTGAIQAAINAIPTGGVVMLMPGTHKITSTININKPVMLRGWGMGSDYGPTSAAPTKLSWAGGASPMVIFGSNGNGNCFLGGGLSDLQLEGNALATQCLRIKDCQHFNITNVTLTFGTLDALYMTNSSGQITGFGNFKNLHIQLRGGATNSANGIHVVGVSSGADGVTLMVMDNIRIDHANGHGVIIEDFGDAFTWNRLFTYRANSETGYGVWFSTTNPAAICGGHVFIKPVITSGYLFSTAGIHNGTKIIAGNLFDLSPGVNLVQGAGAADVAVDSDLGFAYGRGLLGNNHVSWINDPMQFVRWDSANNCLMTHAGNWITSTSGGNIVDAGQIGGAISVVTSSTSSNSASIQACPFNDGVSVTGSSMVLDTIITNIQTTNVKARFGFMDAVSDPPNNGVYIEADTSQSGFYRCVCMAASTPTVVTTSLGISSTKREFYIFFQPGQAVFLYRNSGDKSMTPLATITTNLPTLALAPVYYVKTLANATARMDVYSHKFAFPDEL